MDNKSLKHIMIYFIKFRILFIISMILSILTSSTATAYIIYINTKKDNQKSWCTGEIKAFDINNYETKDLFILVNQCKEVVLEYGLLEDILFHSKDINKFSKTINTLYLNNKIDNEFISLFSDNALSNNMNNPYYNLDSELSKKPNNIQKIEDKISKYLLFTKEITYKSYTSEQYSIYFYILFTLFKHDIFLIENKKTPVLDLLNIRDSNYNTINPVSSNDLLYLQKICYNIKDVVKREDFLIDSEDIFILTLADIFNSYINKNNKQVLLDKYIKLSKLILKNISTDLSETNENYQWKYINEVFYSGKLILLILQELATYNLNQEELKVVFNEYSLTIDKIDIFYQEIMHKLVYQLFTDDFNYQRNNNEKLYTQLFMNNFHDTPTIHNTELLKYFAINNNIYLVLKSLELSKNDSNLRRDILHAIILSQQINTYRVDYIDVVFDIIDNEQDEKSKLLLIRDSLVLNEPKVIDYAIKHIEANRKYYIDELNNTNYYDGDFYTYSIFSYLARSKTSWVSKKYTMKKKKLKLILSFIEQINNNDNKLYLYKELLSFIDKDDFDLFNLIKQSIQKENNKVLQNKLHQIISNI